ncbi:unnamed protein product [Eretmochelys imbricata]
MENMQCHQDNIRAEQGNSVIQPSIKCPRMVKLLKGPGSYTHHRLAASSVLCANCFLRTAHLHEPREDLIHGITLADAVTMKDLLSTDKLSPLRQCVYRRLKPLINIQEMEILKKEITGQKC